MLLPTCITLPTQLLNQADLQTPKRRFTVSLRNNPALGVTPWGVTASGYLELRLTTENVSSFQKRGQLTHQPCTAGAALSFNNLLLLKSV